MSMLESDSVISERKVKAKGHVYRQVYVFIPRDVAVDSQFPFKTGDPVRVRIDGQRLIIEKQAT